MNLNKTKHILLQNQQRVMQIKLCLISMFVFVILAATLPGCSFRKTPERPFSTWELMAEQALIPDGWELSELSDEPLFTWGEEDAARMEFFFTEDKQTLTKGGITIFRHASEKASEKHFKKISNNHFSPDSDLITSQPYIPDGFDFSSDKTNEWNFICSGFGSLPVVSNSDLCLFLARYEEYVVYFPITIEFDEERIVTGDQIEILVRQIDHNMEANLK